MNDITMIAQSLVAGGRYKGAMVSVQDGSDVKVTGAGALKLGHLALIVLAAYLKEIPEERRSTMATYISNKAMRSLEELD